MAVAYEVACSLFKMPLTVDFELILAMVECNKIRLYLSYTDVKSGYAAYVCNYLTSKCICLQVDL